MNLFLILNYQGIISDHWKWHGSKVLKEAGSSGSLVLNNQAYKPSSDGVLIYFTASSGDLSNELGRVENAGKILLQKRQISEDAGYMALFSDWEGVTGLLCVPVNNLYI